MRISLDSREVTGMILGAPRQVARANLAAVTDIAAIVARDLQTYPQQRAPANPARRYVRTNTLKRSWQKTVEARGASVTGRVRSSGQIAPYNRFVQDEVYQRALFQGYWNNTLQAVGRARQQTAQGIFRRRLAQYVGR